MSGSFGVSCITCDRELGADVDPSDDDALRYCAKHLDRAKVDASPPTPVTHGAPTALEQARAVGGEAVMATQSYDARFLAAAIDQQKRDLAYASDPARATLDVLDAEDRAIARLAREHFDRMGPSDWTAPYNAFWRVHAAYLAILERHPNPRGAPCGG